MSKAVLCTYEKLSRLATAMLISSISLSSYGALPYIEEESAVFKEATFVWPSSPGPNNPHSELQTYEVPQPSSGTYQIDLNSLTLGSDEVIRMVLVQTSLTGVQNVSFEGVRCKTGERKLYAFLQSDGTWREFHQARWQTYCYISQKFLMRRGRGLGIGKRYSISLTARWRKMAMTHKKCHFLSLDLGRK